MKFQSINPATEDTIAEYPVMTAAEALAVGEKVRAAFRIWKTTALSERTAALARVGEALLARKDSLAELMTLEMGKPLAQSAAEIEKCAWVCDYYAKHAAAFLTPQTVATDAVKSFVAFKPLGTVLAIMPWNFPFWQVFRFAAPALTAGNTAILKHAPNVCGCALAIERLFIDAGYPADIFRTVLTDLDVTAQLIDHSSIQAVTLTGSTRAGRAVAARAGHAMKKTVFELGGSDPYLVLEDADVAKAAETCMVSRLINGGQSCISAKRFLVVEEVLDSFVEACYGILEKKTFGNAMEGTYDLGPLARADLRENLQRQVSDSVAEGARCLLGGRIPEGPGFFYPATLLTEVKPGMAAFDEETFGPVAAVVPVAGEAEAIALANRTEYGLGAAVFTRNRERGERIALEALDAGACFVNDFVKSDPRLPFGGIKMSGYGRELSEFGIREFLNIKAVYVK